MNKCRHPEHPHCTHWVLPEAGMCAGGHAQPGPQETVGGALAMPALSPRVGLDPQHAGSLAQVQGHYATAIQERRAQATKARATLHVSGFDPRAAGGRQALRLELRGMPAEVPPQLTMHLKSALLPAGSTRHDFARTRHGDWPSAVIEFSSRGREHGQYPIDVELLAHRLGAPPRRWTCTVVVLVPRPDATLGEIHQTFLATHKNVRVLADDGAIARVGAQVGGGRLDIDVTARNASIAQLDVDASAAADLALPTIAWDEDLIETGSAGGVHPAPTQSGCFVHAAPGAGEVRHIRLFAFDECVLGRHDTLAPIADVLLAHYGKPGPDTGGLTRRLSAQHAILRHGAHGFDIEDVSRFGLLVDGAWPGKHVPVALRPGMRIELSASVRNIVTLEVTALLAHGVALHRVDAGAGAECFYFLAPDCQPGAVLQSALPRGSLLPTVWHARGGFWHLDRTTGRETALCDGVRCDQLTGMPRRTVFKATAYPELQPGRPRGAPAQHPLQSSRPELHPPP